MGELRIDSHFILEKSSIVGNKTDRRGLYTSTGTKMLLLPET